MFLKSLSLRGFKSFAEKTVLEFEPGVTVVVGPNGSGKSNLVDAVAWVLGAQGPRSLRGGRMDDVIFAGTPERSALGRAEVSLTIDNTAHLLPIEFSEVTITRTLFRDGDSEYQLNGVTCRLLDIQELLSDTGIGRQQHVIVGQGQLDEVLTAQATDRRAVIEEAAGVLKFRKRRERAERRLEATEGNMLRLNDLVREVARQLRPLEKQADAARRYGGVEAELRAIRLYLAGHEIAGRQARLERLRDSHNENAEKERLVKARLRELDRDVLDIEHSLTALGHDDTAEALVRAETLRERGRGLRALLAEKQRGLERELTAAADEGVIETLVADAAALRRELADVDEESSALEPKLADVEAAEEGLAAERAAQVAGNGNGADGVLSAETHLAAADERWREAEAEAARRRARVEALQLALSEARSGAGAEALVDVEGVAGPLADHIEIESGAETAVAVGLGDALQAVVLEGDAAARRAVERVKAGDARALVLVAAALPAGTVTTLPALPAGNRPLVDCVQARRADLQDVLARLLAGVVLVEDGWRAALDIVLANPEIVAVTRDGDRLGGAGLWRLGGASTPAVTQAALDDAATDAAAAETARTAAEAARAEAAAHLDAVRSRRRDVEVARAAAAADLDRRANEVAAMRRDLEMRVATLAERWAVLTRRLEGVDARLSSRDADEQAAAEARRASLATRERAYREVERRLSASLEGVDAVHDRLRERRRRQSEAARTSGERLDALRAERATLEQESAEAREKLNRAEIDEAETRMRLDNAVEKLRADFDCEPSVALDAPQPEAPEGTTLAGRARELERELRMLGPINPLALQEHDALAERHAFLQQQLDDVKESRRELMRVIRAVDREIVTVFQTAFDDVSEHFTALFATLFPGGSGRVLLTDPDDILNTGIEIEARPSGKNVRRLSLLSGGERSLTALAFLFSVFRARPSPFYLLDEVEAALDDVNLHRFLDLVDEFRNEAQLVIVTHQKRTMEAGDILYGVSMPPGGSSKVVSQRVEEAIRNAEPAPA
ncbi:MAG TPA: AAA family ATPase [Acidimicrobiia bacterium]|nr:AAA family ATPase [Acidimicrobiia bacterium]